MAAISALAAPPPAYAPLGDALTRLDTCLALGFGRLGQEQHAALASLSRALTGTPLHERLSAAITSLRQGEFREGHFLTLAAARAALQGALYDALHGHALTALSRPLPVATPAQSSFSTEPAPLLESVRHWLMEIALAGFSQLEPEAILPFQATLERLQAEPAHFRLAALLTGFCDELLALAPTTGQANLPLYRFADLWTRAALLCARPRQAATSTQTVSGDLRILGADLRTHRFAVALVVYGVLQTPQGLRLLRLTRSAYKVDVVTGREVLRTLAAPQLLRALAESRVLTLHDVPVLPGGDLLYDRPADTRAKVGGGFELWSDAARFAPGLKAPAPTLGPVDLLDRHPTQLAEPLFLERPRLRPSPAEGGVIAELGEVALLIDTAHQSPTSELLPDKVGAAQRLFGLLRFDGGRFRLQPLAVQGGAAGKLVTAVAGQNAAAIALGSVAGSPIGKLRERASKLLRQKA